MTLRPIARTIAILTVIALAIYGLGTVMDDLLMLMGRV